MERPQTANIWGQSGSDRPRRGRHPDAAAIDGLLDRTAQALLPDGAHIADGCDVAPVVPQPSATCVQQQFKNVPRGESSQRIKEDRTSSLHPVLPEILISIHLPVCLRMKGRP